MKKFINSEKKYQNKNFKVKVGTVNKKRPEVVYMQLGTYIKPNEEKESFTEYINNFDKEARAFINNLINKNKNCYKDFILITDIADERVEKNKKSYLDLQIFIKPLNIITPFKNMADKIYEEYTTYILSYIKNEFESNNIECYKTKK